jgi:hypothetical protein
MSDVFSGRLEKHGIHEHISQMHTTDTCRCLTDGQSGLWVFADEDGLVTTMSRAGLGDLAEAIVAKIMREFDVKIVNSQFPQYHGFETQEEMDAAQEEAAREYRDGLYPQLIAYVRGEPNRIEPDTGGERYAQIACELVGEDSSLLWPENRDAFIHAVQEAFLNRHAVRIELPHEQMEEALRIGALRSKLMLGEVEDIPTDSTQRH